MYIITVDLTLTMNLISANLNSHFDFSYTMTLTSSIISLNGPACLSVHFIAQSQFTITLTYLRDGVYNEKLLHRNILGTCLNNLNIDIPQIQADEQLFAFLFTSTTYYSGPAVAINDIKLSMTTCLPG